MYQRIQSALLNPLLSALSDQDLPDDEPPSKRARLGENDFPTLVSNACLEKPKTEGCVERTELKKKLIRALLDIAESSDARDSNRRKLHALCNEGMEGVE